VSLPRSDRESSNDVVEASEPAGRPARRVLIFTAVSLALLMSSLDTTIVATALHSLQHGLHTSITWAGWTITAYSLGLVLMLPVCGKLSDRYGRRRVFLACVVVFSAASLCCGLVNNIYLLIALRAVQAAGGAGFTPSATGIVVEHFGSARDKAVGLFGSIFPIGSMIGPILGGLFVAYLSWRWIFLVNVPIGALIVVLCLRFVPADPQGEGRRRGPLDARGMVLLGIGVLAWMIAISYLGDPHMRVYSPLLLGPLLAAVLALVAFWWHIGRHAQPFIARRLICGRGFGAVNVINVLYGGFLAGMISLVPLYATNRYGIDALGSGTLLTGEGIAVIVMASLAAFALRRTGYRGPLYVGAVGAALGMVLLAVSPVQLTPWMWLAAATCVVGISSGWSGPASRNAGLQLAPEQSSSLAALRSMGRQVGTICSISIATAIIGPAADPGAAQAWVFAAAAALLLLAAPVITRVPEHRGAW
jgi:EmrB/QacA subfamily drug resistance transporter